MYFLNTYKMLQKIWSASQEQLLPVTRHMKLPDISDLNGLRIKVAQIYAKSGNLSPPEKAIVDDPRFYHTLLADTFQEAIETLSIIPIEEEKKISPNANLIKHFKLLEDINNKIGETYKAKTFKLAAKTLENFQDKITSGSQLSGIKGLGKSTYEEVDQFLQNPQTKRLSDLLTRLMPEDRKEITAISSTGVTGRENIIKSFAKIFGVGPVKAEELYDLGYRSINDIDPANLTQHQRIGLKYYYHLQERIPHTEMIEFDRLISNILTDVVWLMTGSYRRCKASSGDIDIVCKTDEWPQRVAQILIDAGVIKETLASGPEKFMGIAILGEGQIYRRIDIRSFNEQQWPYGILYNTGSDDFNKMMRVEANAVGLGLNEYTLKKIDPPYTEYPATSEKDIFAMLSIPYVLPRNR